MSENHLTVAINISKAFDAVQHSLLLDQICNTDLHPNLVHWLAAYLRGRQSCVDWQGASSPWRNVKTGGVFFGFFYPTALLLNLPTRTTLRSVDLQST